MTPIAPFHVAILGAGASTPAHLAGAKASAGRIVVVAGVDTNAGAGTPQVKAPGVKTFPGVAEFLAAVKTGSLVVHGAVVCLPPPGRTLIVGTLLEAGLPLLIEQPLANTLADAKKLVALGGKHAKVPAFIGFSHRFTPAVSRMKEMIGHAKIGRLVRVESVLAGDFPAYKDDPISDPVKSGGGALLDMGAHMLDLFHFIAGPARVEGAAFDFKWPRRAETSAAVLLRSIKAPLNAKNIKPGVAGVIAAGWAEANRSTLTLVGDAGTLTHDFDKPREILFRDLAGKPEPHGIEGNEARFTRQLVAFADAVQNKIKTPLATIADGLAVVELDVEIRKAAKQ